MANEGYDYELVKDVQNDLYCLICLKIMRDAMQLDCGHGLCNFCLQSLDKSSTERNVPFLCPSCRTVIDLNKIHPATMINRLILTTKVKCVNTQSGCQWIGEVGDMNAHQNSCTYELMNCNYESCKEMIQRGQLKQHESDCGYRTSYCDYCGNQFQYISIPIHFKTCECFPVLCPNDCQTSVPRKEITFHMNNSCHLRLVECSFSSVGCIVKVLKSDLSQHISDATQEHLMLVTQKLQHTHREQENTQVKLEKTEIELQNTKSEIKNIQVSLQAKNIDCNVNIEDEPFKEFLNSLNAECETCLLDCKLEVMNLLYDHPNVTINVGALEDIVEKFASAPVIQDFIAQFEAENNKINLPKIFFVNWEKSIKPKLIVEASIACIKKLMHVKKEANLLCIKTKLDGPTVKMFGSPPAVYHILNVSHPNETAFTLPNNNNLLASVKDGKIMFESHFVTQGCLRKLNMLNGAELILENSEVVKELSVGGFILKGQLLIKFIPPIYHNLSGDGVLAQMILSHTGRPFLYQ